MPSLTAAEVLKCVAQRVDAVRADHRGQGVMRAEMSVASEGWFMDRPTAAEWLRWSDTFNPTQRSAEEQAIASAEALQVTPSMEWKDWDQGFKQFFCGSLACLDDQPLEDGERFASRWQGKALGREDLAVTEIRGRVEELLHRSITVPGKKKGSTKTITLAASPHITALRNCDSWRGGEVPVADLRASDPEVAGRWKGTAPVVMYDVESIRFSTAVPAYVASCIDVPGPDRRRCIEERRLFWGGLSAVMAESEFWPRLEDPALTNTPDCGELALAPEGWVSFLPAEFAAGGADLFEPEQGLAHSCEALSPNFQGDPDNDRRSDWLYNQHDYWNVREWWARAFGASSFEPSTGIPWSSYLLSDDDRYVANFRALRDWSGLDSAIRGLLATGGGPLPEVKGWSAFAAVTVLPKAADVGAFFDARAHTVQALTAALEEIRPGAEGFATSRRLQKQSQEVVKFRDLMPARGEDLGEGGDYGKSTRWWYAFPTLDTASALDGIAACFQPLRPEYFHGIPMATSDVARAREDWTQVYGDSPALDRVELRLQARYRTDRRDAESKKGKPIGPNWVLDLTDAVFPFAPPPKMAKAELLAFLEDWSAATARCDVARQQLPALSERVAAYMVTPSEAEVDQALALCSQASDTATEAVNKLTRLGSAKPEVLSQIKRELEDCRRIAVKNNEPMRDSVTLVNTQLTQRLAILGRIGTKLTEQIFGTSTPTRGACEKLHFDTCCAARGGCETVIETQSYHEPQYTYEMEEWGMQKYLVDPGGWVTDRRTELNDSYAPCKAASKKDEPPLFECSKYKP